MNDDAPAPQTEDLEDPATLALSPGDEDEGPPLFRPTLLSMLRREDGGAPVRPSAPPDFIQGCTGKIGYSSKSVALVWASRYLFIDYSDRPAPLALRCYWCRHCYKWHLTSRV